MHARAHEHTRSMDHVKHNLQVVEKDLEIFLLKGKVQEREEKAAESSTPAAGDLVKAGVTVAIAASLGGVAASAAAKEARDEGKERSDGQIDTSKLPEGCAIRQILEQVCMYWIVCVRANIHIRIHASIHIYKYIIRFISPVANMNDI